MRILSWDCAYRSLAYVILEVNTEELYRLRTLSRADIERMQQTHERAELCGWLKFIAAEVINIDARGDERTGAIAGEITGEINGKITGDITGEIISERNTNDARNDSREISRVVKLMQYLRRDFPSPRDFDRVIIELQPGKYNPDSYGVSLILASYFADGFPEFISPKLKNKITLASGLEFDRYREKYSDSKRARKQHATDSFTYFGIAWGRADILGRIPRVLREHVGDALLQALYTIKFII